ncbi:Nickel transport system permease protein NikC [compost metagenome]
MRRIPNGILHLHRWIGPFGWGLLGLIMIMALSPWLVPYDPYDIHMGLRLQPSSLDYWLGTDGLGRDLLSRLLIGGRNTLGTSLAVLTISLLVGIPIGLIAGYAGGWIDRIFMRTADAFMAFPDFLVALVLSGLLGPHIINLMLAIAAVKWIAYARIVRNIVRDEKEKEYIAVAHLNGLCPLQLLAKHLLPHALRHVIVLASLDIGKITLLIASLSYIGLGMQPPAPEWGAMLNEGRVYFHQSPYLMIWPGLAIMISVALASLTGDRIRAKLGIQAEGGARG